MSHIYLYFAIKQGATITYKKTIIISLVVNTECITLTIYKDNSDGKNMIQECACVSGGGRSPTSLPKVSQKLHPFELINDISNFTSWTL